jgi:hypothetical protein
VESIGNQVSSFEAAGKEKLLNEGVRGEPTGKDGLDEEEDDPERECEEMRLGRRLLRAFQGASTAAGIDVGARTGEDDDDELEGDIASSCQ